MAAGEAEGKVKIEMEEPRRRIPGNAIIRVAKTQKTRQNFSPFSAGNPRKESPFHLKRHEIETSTCRKAMYIYIGWHGVKQEQGRRRCLISSDAEIKCWSWNWIESGNTFHTATDDDEFTTQPSVDGVNVLPCSNKILQLTAVLVVNRGRREDTTIQSAQQGREVDSLSSSTSTYKLQPWTNPTHQPTSQSLSHE